MEYYRFLIYARGLLFTIILIVIFYNDSGLTNYRIYIRFGTWFLLLAWATLLLKRNKQKHQLISILATVQLVAFI
jgi:hypothetical protein